MVVICKDVYPANNEAKYSEYFASFPYPLSDFQKWSIEAIVEGHHTLVCAPTGSGKTLPAEFAIEYFVKQKGKKVIYTSPIKALSNQKYAEFSRKFPDIQFGLMTGDIKTNPDADVLIMTTEILMNALFLQTNNTETNINENKSLQFQMDYANDLGCVVFDEVHYINDADRGQTWEKTILMLPKHIQMVMLSATIDKKEQFAKWCERGDNEKQVYLCSTDKRVVPLSHYGYTTISESTIKLLKDKELEKEIRDNTQKLIPLQTDKGVFQEAGYKTLTRVRTIIESKRIFVENKRKYVLNNLGLFLRDREMLPAIAFVFSRKNVEKFASEITVPLLEDDSKIPYTVARECDQIVRKLPNFQEYLELPEYQSLVKLLEKGVGIHHSGMIPILREIVEIMISKKYIKMLFATESFAIGLDCPIRTAIFTGITKFDGNYQRILMSHEYTQMAGRAGRRGIDTIGYVVHCNDLFDLPTATEYKAMLGGKPQTLISKFRISYPLILNLLRNGKGKTADFIEFVNKSMISEELSASKQAAVLELATSEENYKRAQECIAHLRTPEDICRQYIAAELGAKTAVNKKRKDFDKQMRDIRETHKFVMNDIAKIHDLDKKAESNRELLDHMNYLDEYVANEVDRVVSVLLDRGFVSTDEPDQYETEFKPTKNSICSADSYSSGSMTDKEINPSPKGADLDLHRFKLTHLGEIAAGLAEIHPLALSHWILEWEWFCYFTPVQLVGLLACFTDVKVLEEERHSFPYTEDNWLKERINELRQTYEDIPNNNDVLNFDMTDFAIEWTQCSDERECKVFIQNRITEKEISIGDFTKAMMKIATIVQELMTIAECAGQIECMHKLSQIGELIRKYVTTSQSLYV